MKFTRFNRNKKKYVCLCACVIIYSVWNEKWWEITIKNEQIRNDLFISDISTKWIDNDANVYCDMISNEEIESWNRETKEKLSGVALKINLEL